MTRDSQKGVQFAIVTEDAFEAVKDMKNKSTLFHVLAALLFFRNRKTGLCCPRVETLADLTGLSVRTVRRAIERLEEADIVKRIERKTERGTNDSNEYRLPGHVCPPTRSGMTAPPGQDCPAPPVTDGRDNREGEQRRLTDTLSSSSESDEPFQLTAKPKSKDDTNAEAFLKFWDAYPRKVAKAKAKAAFKKAIAREGGDDDARQRIINAAEAFAKSPAGKAGKFCPYPTTWLNDDRFNDNPLEWENRNDKDAAKYRPSDVDRRPAETIEV